MLNSTDYHLVKIPSSLSSDPASDAQPYLGPTVCLLQDSVIQTLLATVDGAGLPDLEPSRCRVGPGQHGLGLFATCNLSFGDLIIMERPFSIVPTILPLLNLSERLSHLELGNRQRVIMEEWETRYLRPLVASLNPGVRNDYMALANAHAPDECPSILGIIRTNGLEVGNLQPDITPSDEKEHSAVCGTMSRINHSCRPNAERSFDLRSFTFQLRLVRDVAKGEEITIAYCGILQTTNTRQKELAEWGFRCMCLSCVGNVSASDEHRYQAWQSMKEIEGSWDPFQRIRNSLHYLSLIAEEGLEASGAYGYHLEALKIAYMEVGDANNSKKFGELLRKCTLAQTGKEPEE